MFLWSFAASSSNNIKESWLKRGPSDQKSINILDFYEFIAIFLSHTASINNTSSFSLPSYFAQVLSDPSVDFVNLLSSSSLTSADSPHRFISQNDISPVWHFFSYRIKLSLYNCNGLTSLSFSQRLSEAENDFELVFEGDLYFLSNDLVSFPEMGASLWVA